MSDKYPKNISDKLPEGFQYSDEAKKSLRKRAKEANQELRSRVKQNKTLKYNVNEVMKLAGEESYE